MRHLLLLTALVVLSTPIAVAQDGFFDNVYLDGVGSSPFVRFDQPNGDQHFAVGFGDEFALYVTNGYKFRAFETADSDALTLNDLGVNVNKKLNIDTVADLRQIEISHPTDQTFAVTSFSSSQAILGGGIGFATDSFSTPFFVFDGARDSTLSVSENGVGVGNYVPDELLHVYSDGFTFPKAKILVENDIQGPAVARNMFQLVNNGGCRFSFTDTSTSSSWVFASTPSGAFSISKDGTGGSEFIIHPSGRVLMGPGGAQNLDLKPNGNLHIAGTLVQSSDRALKTNFVDVNDSDVLDRVAHMPVQAWQFKFDEPNVRHVGPTAQDFRAAFGLGQDDKTIAPVDGIGVSLASIKALKQESDDHQNRLKALENLVQAQQQQLAEQTKLISALAKRLDENGIK